MHDLMNLLKTNQPGVSLSIADMIGGRGMDDTVNSSGYKQAIEELQRAVGINHIVQVNDCATIGDWTESANGVLDIAADTTNERLTAKNAAIKMTATAATNATQYCQTLFINESSYVPLSTNGKRQMNWEDTDYIGFWKHATNSGDYGTDGELQLAIINDGEINPISGTAQSVFSVDGTTGTSHHWCQTDISTYDRDKVESLRFYSNNANAAEYTLIDEIIRYKWQLGGGPMYGKYFYVKSGTTLTESNYATWSIDGLIAGGTAALTDLGMSYLGAATLTGNATRSNYALLPTQFLFLVKATGALTAGEGLEVASATAVDDVDSGSEEMAVAKALEAAGETGDWIFACLDVGGTEI